MAKKNKQKTTYKASNHNWIYFVFFIGLLIAGYFFYNYFFKVDRIHYKEFGIYIPSGNYLHGIDVSKYQKNIDWNQVDSMNIKGISFDFAFIKATEGTSLKDRKFDRNWDKISETDIKRGAYHFFRCNRDGVLQADFFLKTVNFKEGDLFPVLDIETTDGKSTEIIRKRVKDFLNRIEEKLDVKPIIYTNADFYKRHLSSGEFDEYPFWVAHYRQPNAPRTKRNWDFWQHSDKGRVNSIRGDVDFNVFKGDEDDLEDLLIAN